MSTIFSIDLLSTNPTIISSTGGSNNNSYFVSDFSSSASKVVSLDVCHRFLINIFYQVKDDPFYSWFDKLFLIRNK